MQLYSDVCPQLIVFVPTNALSIFNQSKEKDLKEIPQTRTSIKIPIRARIGARGAHA